MYTNIMNESVSGNGRFVVGLSSPNLQRRVYEHKNDIVRGFTQKYIVHNLVYYEVFDDVNEAIKREKQLKKWNRAWKIALIEKDNLEWKDLWLEMI